MKDKYFFLTCILFLCVFLAGVFIGATIAAKAQREIDRQQIEVLTEKNLQLYERVENIDKALRNALGLR